MHMPELTVATVLQVILALGLLNVWLLRSGKSTGYRGGSASSLREEFATYGLPVWFFYLVGVLKIGSACALLAGLWMPALVQPAASVIVVLMAGAIAMHIKVKDPLVKSAPAFLMLVLSASLLATGF